MASKGKSKAKPGPKAEKAITDRPRPGPLQILMKKKAEEAPFASPTNARCQASHITRAVMLLRVGQGSTREADGPKIEELPEEESTVTPSAKAESPRHAVR